MGMSAEEGKGRQEGGGGKRRAWVWRRGEIGQRVEEGRGSQEGRGGKRWA